MLRSALHNLHRGLAVMIAVMLVSLSAVAQTATEDTPQQAVQLEPAAEQAQEASTLDSAAQPEIDLSDPALTDALEAREKADRAIAKAVRAQQEKATLDTSAAAEEESPKKSLIPTSVDDVKVIANRVKDKLLSWLTNPSFLAQLGAIVVAYLVSPLLAGTLKKRVFLFRDIPQDGTKLKIVRDYIYRSRDFLRAVMLVALLALFAVILKAVPIGDQEIGQDWLVKLAQGLAVVFLLYKAIRTFIGNELIRKITTWVAIPLALLMTFGYFDNLLDALNGAELMKMGDTPITAMTLVRLAIFGGLFFWLGNMSNAKGQTAIRSQEGLDIGVREIVAKLFQILLFIILFVWSSAHCC